MITKKWIKEGQLLVPDSNVWWMNQHVGPSYFHLTDDSHFELFVTGRDLKNISRIAKITGKIDGCKLSLGPVPSEPIFDVGKPGCFDESGVSYPWLLKEQDELLMFYVGWVAGGMTGFQNYTGLATLKIGSSSFERVSPVPILDRNRDEPYGSGSCAVIREGSSYIMLYTSFYQWKNVTYKTRDYAPSYDIKLATSSDGRTWHRGGQVAIALEENETIVGKPSIFKNLDGTFTVYFSARGENYKIYRADGPSLSELVRSKEVELDASLLGWDSQMVEYCHVVQCDKYLFMIYNGNEFGKTGLGYAWASI